MRFLALATDYDGTLAHDGVVDTATIAALERLRASGRRAILATGREMPELIEIFPRLDLFDLVVAENGGLLYFPRDRRELPLSDPPPESFVTTLVQNGVTPLSVGRVIVATWESQGPKVLDAIRAHGLELQLIFNKGALMVLPSGINKATGLTAALTELKLSPHNVVGVGDAENDHALLRLCECGVAVSNALPALKEHADTVTRGARGLGVTELIDALVRDDLSGSVQALCRHDILLGRSGGADLRFPVYGHNLLVAGSSGSGKSTVTTGFVERLLECKYQVCIVDPEGDYEKMGDAVVFGDTRTAPALDAAIAALENPEHSVVLNLLGLRIEERPAFFERLIPRLEELRARTGRPHWIIVDEAHHVLPATATPPVVLPPHLTNLLLITVQPEHVAPAVVQAADSLIVLGKDPAAAARAWRRSSVGGGENLPRGEALLWRREYEEPVRFQVAPCRTVRVRHSRKYAEGDLPFDHSFYFRGPEGRLNLRARNLTTFLQLAEGVDQETWMYHLRLFEYSRWFRSAIHHDDLAEEAEAIEKDGQLSAAESRKRIQEAITRRFTLPA